MTKEQKVEMPLLVAAVFSLAFLFSVSYTNASFTALERPLPDPFAPENISPKFAYFLETVSENMEWAVETAAAEAKGPVLAFLGLEDYQFGQPRHTSLASQAQLRILGQEEESQAVIAEGTPQVLGAYYSGEETWVYEEPEFTADELAQIEYMVPLEGVPLYEEPWNW